MKGNAQPNVMKTINEYAGGHRHLITLGRILAAVSVFAGLVPFYDLWVTVQFPRRIHKVKSKKYRVKKL